MINNLISGYVTFNMLLHGDIILDLFNREEVLTSDHGPRRPVWLTCTVLCLNVHMIDCFQCGSGVVLDTWLGGLSIVLCTSSCDLSQMTSRALLDKPSRLLHIVIKTLELRVLSSRADGAQYYIRLQLVVERNLIVVGNASISWMIKEAMGRSFDQSHARLDVVVQSNGTGALRLQGVRPHRCRAPNLHVSIGRMLLVLVCGTESSIASFASEDQCRLRLLVDNAFSI